jgi:DNA (cytosine-5)-methyltransferase 1
MNELSLFSGAGGGLLATKHLLGWRTIGYVEWDDYCQRVLAQRIKDGLLDEAPIFGDIRAFINEGYAERYRGMVDILTAGFPCQPFSVAGKRQGEDDERNMWPQTIECICIIRPRYAFLENVPGLLTHEYIRRIYGDLAEAGYDARWCVLGADDCGAIHRRKRLWILAYPTIIRSNRSTKTTLQKGKQVENTKQSGNRRRGEIRGNNILGNENVSNTNKFTWSQWEDWRILRKDCGTCSRDKNKKIWCKDRFISQMGEANNTLPYIETIKSDICRVDDGVANQLDRLKAIGNGQVPAVVRAVWEILNSTQGG